MKLEIHLELLSDATFGRGDGIAGLIDEEVEHDPVTGLPFLRGRTLKGLLVEECMNILFVLRLQSSPPFPEVTLLELQEAAKFLFGEPGSSLEGDAKMQVAAALLPEALREAVTAEIESGDLRPADILESLTAIRRQTAIAETTGAPEKGSLRALRVILRGTQFISILEFDRPPNASALALLAGSVKSLRRAGTARNRGRGRLRATLHDEQGNDITDTHFSEFEKIMGEKTR